MISAPKFGVSDFVAIFNQSLDMMYPQVGIVGELANFRISKGMWVYFDLKDDDASVKFFGTVRALPGPLEEGMLLEVTGRPHLHPKFGFSIQFELVQAVGDGSIKKAQRLLAEKLEKEGLFDPSRKRVLPLPPAKIGLVTSADSAAFGDFTKIIAARWPNLGVELFNVQVQGADAPAQIIGAIEEANQKVNQLEVLVLIRGGGSADDLAAFDHEQVVRAIAASRIPTLVAIGHERDVCLSELAADVRASTPSNAAELLVPDRTHEKQVLRAAAVRLDELLQAFTVDIRRDLKTYKQQLDERLVGCLQNARQQLAAAVQLSAALDPKQPLERGYVLARTADKRVIRLGSEAQKMSSFDLEFSDKIVEVKPK